LRSVTSADPELALLPRVPYVRDAASAWFAVRRSRRTPARIDRCPRAGAIVVLQLIPLGRGTLYA